MSLSYSRRHYCRATMPRQDPCPGCNRRVGDKHKRPFTLNSYNCGHRIHHQDPRRKKIVFRYIFKEANLQQKIDALRALPVQEIQEEEKPEIDIFTCVDL